MIKSITIALINCLWIAAVQAQPLFQLDGQYWRMPAIDKIIQSYNLGHPWQTKKIAPIGQSYGISAGWNQPIYAPRAFQAIALINYRYQTTQIESNVSTLVAGFHMGGISAHLRSHPRCLIKKVQETGPLGTRWYVQCGGGYQWNLPFARKHGERVTLYEDEPYRSISGGWQLSIGTGWHALSIGRVILTFDANAYWLPSLELNGFARAIQGHNELQLSERAQNVWMLQGGLRFTWSKMRKNWWDEPRHGDKS
jgi:hypothetical protein